MSKGRLFVISGASGVGKSSVLGLVMKQCPGLQFSVSATTRPPRPGEADGVNYYFISKEQFQQMIAEDAFIEYDAHMGNYYGTPKRELQEKLQYGDLFLDIEPVGAFNVRKINPEAILIFITPPSLEELERRLRSRGDTSEEQMKLRLERAKWEMEQSKQYNYVVVNDVLEDCAKEIMNIIAKEAE